MKVCSKCHIEKDESEFSLRLNHGKKRIDSWCKVCSINANKEWRARNDKRLKEYAKNYRIINKEKESVRNKEWRLKNKEKIYESNKEYRVKNKDKCKKWAKEWYGRNRQKVYGWTRSYAKSHPDIVKKAAIKYYINNIDIIKQKKLNRITDGYISHLIKDQGIKPIPELIPFKRNILILKRDVWQSKKQSLKT